MKPIALPSKQRVRLGLIFLSIASLLGACSTQVSALKPTALSEKAPKTPYVFDVAATTLRVASKTTLMPGVYRPIGQNDEGVWYVGGERNVRIFYPERKRSDGKRLLASYTGGVLVPLKPDRAPTLFIIRSTEKLMLVSEAPDTEADVSISLTAGQISSEAVLNAGGNSIVGAAVGSAVADGLLAYDAKGLQLLPFSAGAPGVVAWLDSR